MQNKSQKNNSSPGSKFIPKQGKVVNVSKKANRTGGTRGSWSPDVLLPDMLAQWSYSVQECDATKAYTCCYSWVHKNFKRKIVR